MSAVDRNHPEESLVAVDSHAHLDDRAFDKDRAAVIANLFHEGVGVVTIGTSLRSSEAAVTLASKHRRIWATVGIHPHNAKFVTDRVLEQLRGLAGRASVVGIGEIGLDYYRDLSPRDVQRKAFRAQLDLAASLELPVSLHNRESTEDFLAILRGTGVRHGGIVHSFLGDGDLADAFLRLGLHLGVGGPLTYAKNQSLRAAIQSAPLERLLVETDCPYLTPVPHRGKRNEPAYVRYVIEQIAHLKGMDPSKVARATTENAIRVFGLR